MLSCDDISEIRDALDRGDLSRKKIRSLRMHLEGCAQCRAVLNADRVRPVAEALGLPLQPCGSKHSAEISEDTYSRVLDRVFESILDENTKIEDQRLTAPSLLAELLSFSTGQRRLLVRNSTRYQVWALAEEALNEARRGWTEDPRCSEDVALLAVEITSRLKVDGFRESLLNDLKAEAWSFVANCRRIQTDFDEAEKAFQRAETALSLGSGDLLERARLLDLRASLCVDTGNYAVAEQLLSEAIEHYRAVRERHLEGRALMKRAKLLRLSGRVEEAIPVLKRATDLIRVSEEPWLSFALKKNLMVYLSECGRAGEAQKLLPEVRQLARKHGSRLERLRLLWTEGLMRKELGQVDLAIEVLEQVREGFVATEIGYDAASVSLDLASLYLQDGRNEKARHLATQSIPLFTSRGVHREAIVAWTLFREAAERDALTLGLVQEVASRIRQSQSRPTAGGDLG